ncbi:MAG TPA: response regulator [Steroidobacteraceae bacterium]|nr:response regulator [Steroidobacteraceae bacterium]
MSANPPLRVLLVEDSTLLAARLAELIERLPDVDLIATVDTEAAALRRIALAQPDVVILDLLLRDGSGFAVLRTVRGATTGVYTPRVIVLTNFDLPEFRRAAEELQVDAFLDKSRDFDRLPDLLTGIHRERTSPQPQPN